MAAVPRRRARSTGSGALEVSGGSRPKTANFALDWSAQRWPKRRIIGISGALEALCAIIAKSKVIVKSYRCLKLFWRVEEIRNSPGHGVWAQLHSRSPAEGRAAAMGLAMAAARAQGSGSGSGSG